MRSVRTPVPPLAVRRFEAAVVDLFAEAACLFRQFCCAASRKGRAEWAMICTNVLKLFTLAKAA
jgi:hypothetical protein